MVRFVIFIWLLDSMSKAPKQALTRVNECLSLAESSHACMHYLTSAMAVNARRLLEVSGEPVQKGLFPKFKRTHPHTSTSYIIRKLGVSNFTSDACVEKVFWYKSKCLVV